jgi:hypothetical protein
MIFFDKKNATVDIWLPIIGGPILGLGSFVGAWMFDPEAMKEMSGIPAFLFSMIVLMISQWFVTVRQMQKTAENSDKLHDAIKNYLHVTPVGSPEEALRYIEGRLPAIREVMNTSFNIEEESERSDEKLYQTQVYDNLSKSIAVHCSNRLIWKDIGDTLALNRFRKTKEKCVETGKGKQLKYKYRVISHNEPQINFILLEYSEGSKEVLFNWDFRGLGQDPTVLISRDNHMVEMFTIQFNLLWRRASEDHDNQATRSTSEK